jgi:hypothetical protein
MISWLGISRILATPFTDAGDLDTPALSRLEILSALGA